MSEQYTNAMRLAHGIHIPWKNTQPGQIRWRRVQLDGYFMSRLRLPFSPAEALRIALENASVADEAERVFVSSPALQMMALKFTRFVSPLVAPPDGEPVIEKYLRAAVESYWRHEHHDLLLAHKTYLAALMGAAEDLRHLRMSVRTDDNTWLIWGYDEPLADWMSAHGRKSLQTRVRDEPMSRGPIAIKLLSHICSVRDMIRAGFDVQDLLQRE